MNDGLSPRQQQILNRIITSRQEFELWNVVYLYNAPNYLLRSEADSYYFNLLKELSAYKDLPTEKQLLRDMYSTGMWSADLEKTSKRLEREIEDIKINMYKIGRNKENTKQLKQTQRSLERLLRQRHSLDGHTREGFARVLRNNYLFMRCMYVKDSGQPLINLENVIDGRVLTNLMDIFSSAQASQTDIRVIARKEPWRSIWLVGKEQAFGVSKSAVDLTDEQRLLINISQMYDSAYGHSEAPPNDVIEDDDRFDGWMAFVRRKTERRRAETNLGENLSPKIKNSQEIFLMARNDEEAKRIYELNEGASRHVIKQRQQMLQKHGKLHEAQLPDAISRAREQAQK